jgi:hypothetical protein
MGGALIGWLLIIRPPQKNEWNSRGVNRSSDGKLVAGFWGLIFVVRFVPSTDGTIPLDCGVAPSGCCWMSPAAALCLMTRMIDSWDRAWSFPRLPRRQLSSILSETMCGQTYKAPHEAYCPPGAETLTSTVWHGGGLLPNFGLEFSVSTPDCKSSSGWVRCLVTSYELLIAHDIPVDEHTHLTHTWCDKVLTTLHGWPPVCVLRLLEDAMVPLWDIKAPGFTGWGGAVGN